MIRTIVTRKLALEGLVPAGKLSHVYRSLLPILALCMATAAWSQTGPRVKGGSAKPISGAQPVRPAPATAASAQYRFVTIQIPGAGGLCGYYCDTAFGVNDARLVAGQYTTGSASHGFVWQRGTLYTLDYPGAADTYLIGTNNRGVLIGDYTNGVPNTNYAFTYSLQSGAWTILPDIPNFPNNEGYSINDFGVAVGEAYGDNTSVAWVWHPSSQSYSFVTVPGSAPNTTYMGGINDKGHVVGQFQDAGGVWHGFLKDGATYTTIDPPGSTYTYPSGINSNGTIVGQWQNFSGWWEGFVRTNDGVFTVVDFPGALETQIFGINNRGDICGEWVDPNAGQWIPFVAYKQ